MVVVYDPDGKPTGAGTSWTPAPARRRAGTAALSAPSLGPATRAPNRPARRPSLVPDTSPRFTRGSTYSGRYSRSPVAGLYQTRIGLPVEGSVKTSLVG